MRVLVTRPEPDASETAERLAALGFEPVIWPLMEMDVLGTPLPPDPGWRGVALTSANGLRALAARGDLASLAHLPAFTVGDRTAEAARRAGFAEVKSASGGGARLAALLASDGVEGPLLYPSAKERSFDLAAALAAYGIGMVTHEVYRMVAAKTVPETISAALAAGNIGAVTLYSRRTAESFAKLGLPLMGAQPRPMVALCLSAAVAEALSDTHLTEVRLAERPDESGMLALAMALAHEEKARTSGSKGPF